MQLQVTLGLYYIQYGIKHLELISNLITLLFILTYLYVTKEP